MKLIYIGTHDEVIVPLPLGGEATVKNGEVLSTSDEHAENLLMQPMNWVQVQKNERKSQQTPKPAATFEE